MNMEERQLQQYLVWKKKIAFDSPEKGYSICNECNQSGCSSCESCGAYCSGDNN